MPPRTHTYSSSKTLAYILNGKCKLFILASAFVSLIFILFHSCAPQSQISEPVVLGVYNFSTEWFHPELPQWQLVLSEFQGEEIHALEIGVFEGRSSVWTLENVLTNPKSTLTAIDSFEGVRDYNRKLATADGAALEKKYRANIAATGKQNQVEINKGKSFDVLLAWNADINRPKQKFSIAYVDGAHEADWALADAVLVWPLVKNNGIIIFDDYALRRYKEPTNNANVGVDAFVASHQHEIEILETNYQLAIRKTVKEPRRYTHNA